MKKNLVPFDELGFRVFLIDPPFVTMPDGTRAPCPNMKKLQEAAFVGLVGKHSRLTGNEVRFLRKYLKKTQVEFAKWLNMANHSVISQWENREDDLSGMDYNTEVLLRLQAMAFISHRKSISVEAIDQMRGLSTKKETLELSAA
jgi:DNA-binding transcriptional regulator YiaG